MYTTEALTLAAMAIAKLPKDRWATSVVFIISELAQVAQSQSLDFAEVLDDLHDLLFACETVAVQPNGGGSCTTTGNG